MALSIRDNDPYSLSYNHISFIQKKGFRNGNWHRLNYIEKALYSASLSLAKMRGRLVNSKLILQIRYIISKLRETTGDKLMLTAYQRANKLYELFTSIGLFEWAPQAKSWFNDPDYISWLGLNY